MLIEITFKGDIGSGKSLLLNLLKRALPADFIVVDSDECSVPKEHKLIVRRVES